MPSTPQSKRRRISASSFTVQTWTAHPDRWAPRRKRRETTRSRPDTSGNWNARYGTLPGDIQNQDRCNARRLSSRPALVGMSGAAARAEARTADEKDPRQTRCEAPARRTASTTAGPSRGVLPFHFDDQRGVPVTRQHGIERGDACRGAGPPVLQVDAESAAGIDRGQLGGGAFRHTPGPVRRPFQRAIMNDDHLPVARQVDVEFQAVSAGCDAGVERHQRVLGSHGASTAMREHERNPVGECGR